MTQQARADLLTRARLGRLGCSQANQPYVVPCYFAYSDNYLYSFTTLGRKIECMRANPLVCVEVDEVVSPEEWSSVIVFGRYEELPDTPDYKRERAVAHDVLQSKGPWWEPGYVKTLLHRTERPLVPVFYRIRISDVTGHRATP